MTFVTFVADLLEQLDLWNIIGGNCNVFVAEAGSVGYMVWGVIN